MCTYGKNLNALTSNSLSRNAARISSSLTVALQFSDDEKRWEINGIVVSNILYIPWFRYKFDTLPANFSHNLFRLASQIGWRKTCFNLNFKSIPSRPKLAVQNRFMQFHSNYYITHSKLQTRDERPFVSETACGNLFPSWPDANAHTSCRCCGDFIVFDGER